MERGMRSLIPPILALLLALWLKNINGALLAGLFSVYMLFNQWNTLLSFGDSVMTFADVFKSTDTTPVVIDTLMPGALLTMIEHSGGISGLVAFFTEKTKPAKSKKRSSSFTPPPSPFAFCCRSVVGAAAAPVFCGLRICHVLSPHSRCL